MPLAGAILLQDKSDVGFPDVIQTYEEPTQVLVFGTRQLDCQVTGAGEPGVFHPDLQGSVDDSNG